MTDTRTQSRRLLVAALIAATASVSAGEVTIYRCTDANGRLTLRDTPCRKGERQEVREMLRPTDPAPRPAARVAPVAAPSTPDARPRVVVVHAPRPMYECVTLDGETYTSESGEGNPRWVPLWTLGYPVWGHGAGIGRGHVDRGGWHGGVAGRFDKGRFDMRLGDGMGARIGAPPPRPPSHGPGPPSGPPLYGLAYPGGTWVRDECYPMPQEEVCDRLRDRRYELDRRYNSALQSERNEITTEQRGIDARLSTDCGVY